MTIQSTVVSGDLFGNGATTVFPFAFKVFDEGHVEVFVDGVLKTLTTDYSVSGVGDETTNIVFVSAPANGAVVSAFRRVPLTQEIDYLENDEFPAETHERGLDLGVMGLQQIDGRVRRALRAPDTDPASVSMVLPGKTARANKFLAFGPGGEPVALDEAPPAGDATVPFTTPEEHGAVGDGSTNDATAFNAAISDAVTTGKLLQGDPSKIYRIATSLNAFGGTLRIADCRFLVPNAVRVLFGNPSWSPEVAVTSLTTATIGGTVVTRVLLPSTSGLAVGDWVKVGSSSVRWPGETDIFWFEAAQIVALTANTSIDLHRRLHGEESSALNANLRLFKVPDYRLEASRLRFAADGNVFQSGQAGRVFGIEVRGGIGHKIKDCHADSWWERFIVLKSAVKSFVINPSWHALPDIPTGNEAFGYGIQESGSCYGNLILGMNGGRCRHGYTSGGVSVASYDAATPWQYGMVGNSVVKASVVTGHDGAGFDTHAGTYGVTLDGCTAQDPVNQPGGLTLPVGFQQRGYRTRVLNCTARGGDTGFRDGGGVTDWGALAPNVCEYKNIAASEYDLDGFLVEGTNGNTSMRVIIDQLSCINGNVGVHIDGSAAFDGSCLVRDLQTAELSSAALQIDSGDAKVELIGFIGRYTDQAEAEVPIKVNVATGTGALKVHNALLLRRNNTDPNGLIEIPNAHTVAATLGMVAYEPGGGTFADKSASSHASSVLNVTDLAHRTWT